MAIFVAFCGVVGAWLVFTFSIYQGLLDMQEQRQLIADRVTVVDKFSPWWWVLPPVKIAKEKARGLQMLASLGLSETTVSGISRAFSRAVAWFYVAIGGALTTLAALYTLLVTGHWYTPLAFWVIMLILLVLGFGQAAVRIDPRHQAKKQAELTAALRDAKHQGKD